MIGEFKKPKMEFAKNKNEEGFRWKDAGADEYILYLAGREVGYLYKSSFGGFKMVNNLEDKSVRSGSFATLDDAKTALIQIVTKSVRDLYRGLSNDFLSSKLERLISESNIMIEGIST